MRILFVDDANNNRELFRLFFWMQGHQAELASDGWEAIMAVYTEEEFDAVVMDIKMPQVNGWKAARAIRSLKRGQQVPLILFTTFTKEEDYQKARQLGVDALLRKPMMPNELLDCINHLKTS